MSEKISEDAVFGTCAQLYMKYVPVVQSSQPIDWEKSEDRGKFARIIAVDFAMFHKAFRDQLREEPEPGK